MQWPFIHVLFNTKTFGQSLNMHMAFVTFLSFLYSLFYIWLFLINALNPTQTLWQARLEISAKPREKRPAKPTCIVWYTTETTIENCIPKKFKTVSHFFLFRGKFSINICSAMVFFRQVRDGLKYLYCISLDFMLI